MPPAGRAARSCAISADRKPRTGRPHPVAMLHQEAARTSEFVGALGNHRHRQFFAGQVRVGSLEKTAHWGLRRRPRWPGVGASSAAGRVGDLGVGRAACVVISCGRHGRSFLRSAGLTHFPVLTRGTGDTPFGCPPHRMGPKNCASDNSAIRGRHFRSRAVQPHQAGYAAPMKPARGAPAVLFDVDGTLVDSNYLHVYAWQRAFDDEGISVAAWQMHRCIGMDGSKLVRTCPKRRIDVRIGSAMPTAGTTATSRPAGTATRRPGFTAPRGRRRTAGGAGQLGTRGRTGHPAQGAQLR